MKTSLEHCLRELGERIQDLRKKKDWSQSELADAAALDRTYVSAVERGKQNITLAALFRIAHALDVLPEALICQNHNRSEF